MKNHCLKKQVFIAIKPKYKYIKGVPYVGAATAKEFFFGSQLCYMGYGACLI